MLIFNKLKKQKQLKLSLLAMLFTIIFNSKSNLI
jgi:hypothetical protein